jgi:hypothetical protein
MAEESQVQPQNPIAPSSNAAQSYTVEMVPGHLRMHTISEDKLDMLVSGTTSVHLTFFGICLGAVISFGIVLYNGALDPTHKLVYQCFLFLSAMMAAYFGIRGGSDYISSRNKLNEIKGLRKSN